MSAVLLDVNVLVALFDPNHPSHEDAHRWFGANRKQGWATCPHTINACVRVLSNLSYPSFDAGAPDVIAHIRRLCAGPGHELWNVVVSLLDDSLFDAPYILGHRNITDVYLLGMAVRRGGRLVTFDGSIPLRSVVGARAAHLEILGG